MKASIKSRVEKAHFAWEHWVGGHVEWLIGMMLLPYSEVELCRVSYHGDSDSGVGLRPVV